MYANNASLVCGSSSNVVCLQCLAESLRAKEEECHTLVKTIKVRMLGIYFSKWQHYFIELINTFNII